jgi:hypothetical protein
VTDKTEPGRSARASTRSPNLLMPRGNRFLSVGASVLLMLGAAIGAFTYRGNLDYRDIIDSNQLVLQTRSENEEFKSQIADKDAQLAGLEAKFKSAQAALDAIMPSKNTYNITPNQSMIVGGGHLTIALVGPPKNEGINISINGKQQSVVAGQVISIALDPSMTCQVGVQSFDMFKAVLNASCATVKPQ